MGRRVVLVVGPPGAGKSTLAAQLASSEGLVHLESEMFPQGGFVDAVRDLGTHPSARAVVVRCCATMDEQRRWEQMAGATETVVLDVDPDVCARRIVDRGRPRWRGELLAAKKWRRARAAGQVVTARDPW